MVHGTPNKEALLTTIRALLEMTEAQGGTQAEAATARATRQDAPPRSPTTDDGLAFRVDEGITFGGAILRTMESRGTRAFCAADPRHWPQ
jgi:hypothetical protein